MLFIVYQTRQRGQPVLPDALLARPSRGIVRYAQGPRDLYGRGVMLARLLDPVDPKKDLIPPIEHARVERVHEFLHIRGIEHFRRTAKAKVDRWDQSWICCVSEAQCQELMQRARERLRAGRRLDWIENISMPSPLTLQRNFERDDIAGKAFQARFDDEDESPFS